MNIDLYAYLTMLPQFLFLLPSLALFFLFYRRSVRAGLSCALSIFMGVCTLMTFPAQFSYGFDAWLYPASTAADFSMWEALFQLTLSCLFAAGLSIPCAKIYAGLVERLSYPQIWYSHLPTGETCPAYGHICGNMSSGGIPTFR